MKRIKRTTGSILEELRDKGYTNKELYKKLGIPERTFYSYKRYFDARQINKHSRKPPKKVENKIRELARNRGIRSTYNLPQRMNILGFAKIAYLYSGEEFDEPRFRNLLVAFNLDEWREISNKKTWALNEVKKRYLGERYQGELELIDVQFVIGRDL